MQNIKSEIKRFGLITDSSALVQNINLDSTQLISNAAELSQYPFFRVLAVDYNFAQKNNLFSSLLSKYQQLIFILNGQNLDPSLFKKTPPHQLIDAGHFNQQTLIDQDQLINEKEQTQVYLNLATELNQEYENIKNELEAKLDETKIDLLTSRQKILDTNLRTEAMRKILYSITQEHDLHRIETVLNDLLPASSKATWIKIVPSQQQTELEHELQQQLNTTFKAYQLPDHVIFFIKGDQKNFKKDDLNLFSKIRDIIDINYSRALNYQNLARTENIVRRAFEEFNHPLAIINDHHELIQSNAAFRSLPHQPQHLSEQLGHKHTTELNGEIYEVYSNPIVIDNNPAKLWINLYKNKTQEHYFEQRLHQTAKVKELGIISSSIAHELNNPIGGILSYLQLIQMDLDKDHTFSPDIKDMVTTTLRMKKIIEDLLIFSRTNNIKDTALHNISELIQENLSIHEIHFKNENIKIVNHALNDPTQILLSKALFRDSLYFIFNFFVEKIKTFRKTHAQKTGLVEVKFSTPITGHSVGQNYSLEFQANCGHLDELEKSKDISLLALSKCLTDQNMHLEITSPRENWISLKVIIPKS